MIFDAKFRLQFLEFGWRAYSASVVILPSFYKSVYKHSVQIYRSVKIILISHSIQCDILRNLHPFSLSIVRRYRLAITTSSHSIQCDILRNLHPFSLSIIRRYLLAITTSSHSVQRDMFGNNSIFIALIIHLHQHILRGGVVGLRQYATSRKVAGLIPDEVIAFFFLIYPILPAVLWPWSRLSL
jgi:hypothetical protein